MGQRNMGSNKQNSRKKAVSQLQDDREVSRRVGGVAVPRLVPDGTDVRAGRQQQPASSPQYPHNNRTTPTHGVVQACTFTYIIMVK